jgi:hypothetical protein
LASVTRTQKNLLAVALGVPLIVPFVGLRVSPAGMVPSVSTNVYGEVPPVGTIAPEYGTPTTPVGKFEVTGRDQAGTAWLLRGDKTVITVRATAIAYFLARLKT